MDSKIPTITSKLRDVICKIFKCSSKCSSSSACCSHDIKNDTDLDVARDEKKLSPDMISHFNKYVEEAIKNSPLLSPIKIDNPPPF